MRRAESSAPPRRTPVRELDFRSNAQPGERAVAGLAALDGVRRRLRRGRRAARIAAKRCRWTSRSRRSTVRARRARFERAAGPWDCTVTWLALPAQFGTLRAARRARVHSSSCSNARRTRRAYQGYAADPATKSDARTGCQPPSLDVPCSLALGATTAVSTRLSIASSGFKARTRSSRFDLEGYEFVRQSSRRVRGGRIARTRSG